MKGLKIIGSESSKEVTEKSLRLKRRARRATKSSIQYTPMKPKKWKLKLQERKLWKNQPRKKFSKEKGKILKPMTIKDIAETVYANESIKNQDVTRKEVYDREEKKLRVQLIQIVDENKTKVFLEETKDLALKFKQMDAIYIKRKPK